MAFLKIFPHEEYNFTEQERFACKSYRFTCKKGSSYKGYRIYRLSKTGAELVCSNDAEFNEGEFFARLKQHVFPSLTESGVISGGHAVVRLDDKYSCGQEPIKSTALAMQMINRLQVAHGKKYDFLIQYNDLYVEFDHNRTNKDAVNENRFKMLNPIILPTAINALVKQTGEQLNRKIPINICFSKNLADKFKRYIKKKKKTSNSFVLSQGENGVSRWDYMLNGKPITVLLNDKPNCTACNAAMLRDIRFNVDNKHVRDNYKSYVGIFPYCSMDNVLNGCSVAFNVYPDLNLTAYVIIYGESCN